MEQIELLLLRKYTPGTKVTWWSKKLKKYGQGKVKYIKFTWNGYRIAVYGTYENRKYKRTIVFLNYNTLVTE